MSRDEKLTPAEQAAKRREQAVKRRKARQERAKAAKETKKRAESTMIRRALERTGWRKNHTARLLNINPATLWKKMKAYGIKKPS